MPTLRRRGLALRLARMEPSLKRIKFDLYTGRYFGVEMKRRVRLAEIADHSGRNSTRKTGLNRAACGVSRLGSPCGSGGYPGAGWDRGFGTCFRIAVDDGDYLRRYLLVVPIPRARGVGMRDPRSMNGVQSLTIVAPFGKSGEAVSSVSLAAS